MYKKFNKKTIFPDSNAKMFHHFTVTHKMLCNALRDRIKLNKDSTVLISGPTGVGKSTMVGKFCFNFFENMENLKKPGEMMYTDENFMVDPELYASKMVIDKGCVEWLDEAIESLSSKNWNSKINKTIITRKNKNRKRGLVSFILIPYEAETDKSFLKHITMWIYVKSRGSAEVYVANNSRKGGQGLSIPRIIEREARYFKENPNKKSCRPIHHGEYIGTIYFGAFTKAEEKRYNALVDKHHATGKLSAEEEEKMNPSMDKKELEKQIPIILDQVEAGTIKSKREMWDKLKEITKFDDALLIRNINRHLKIRGFKNFNSFEI